MNKDHLNKQHSLPVMVLGFRDIAVLRDIITAYIAYTRRTVRPSQQREIECHVLERVHVRLAEMRPQAPEVSLILMVSEMQALNNALLGFSAFVRRKVPPSKERDETLEDVERFRVQLMRMLPSHLN